MNIVRLIAAVTLTAATGLAQAQHLPAALSLQGSCWAFTNLQYNLPPLGGPNWGWYSGSLDTTACPGGGALFPASGPEARQILGYNGKGAALSVDMRPAVPSMLIFVINMDHTVTIKDLDGNLIGASTW